MTSIVILFVILQLADVATTFLALALGAIELNPVTAAFIGQAGQSGPMPAVWGMVGLKLIQAGLAGYCVLTGHKRSLRLANIFFCFIVAWNCIVCTRLYVAKSARQPSSVGVCWRKI